MLPGKNAFTLVEVMVAVSVVGLLVLLVAQLVDQAATLTTLGSWRMDTNEQARQFFDRLTVDFAQMVRRSDVDYYLKSVANSEPGNDQLAFYAVVPGYYPSTGAQSPVSLVAYRISSRSKLERLGKGLVWNAVSTTNTPMVFLPLTLTSTWPTATNATSDPDYETLGPEVLRFEYGYLLNDGSFSETPWIPTLGHSAVDGLRDVTAINITIAAIDSKSRALLTDQQAADLAARMNDFSASMVPGDLLKQWQAGANEAPLRRPILQGLRFYEREFRLAR